MPEALRGGSPVMGIRGGSPVSKNCSRGPTGGLHEGGCRGNGARATAGYQGLGALYPGIAPGGSCLPIQSLMPVGPMLLHSPLTSKRI